MLFSCSNWDESPAQAETPPFTGTTYSRKRPLAATSLMLKARLSYTCFQYLFSLQVRKRAGPAQNPRVH